MRLMSFAFVKWVLGFSLLGVHFTAAQSLVGKEINCGGSHYYFGQNQIYYVEGLAKGQSILGNGFDENKYSFHVPYDGKWHLVRTFDCRAQTEVCEKERMRVSKIKGGYKVEFTTDLKVMKNVTSDPGLSAVIFYTLRDHQIRIQKGYRATAMISQKIVGPTHSTTYTYSDSLGNSFKNNLWRSMGAKSLNRRKCSYVQ